MTISGQFHYGSETALKRALSRVPTIFFQLFYHHLAGFYDRVTGEISMGHWQAWLGATLPYLEGPRVLEIGHGTGILQELMAQRALWCVGLDSSRQMGELTRRRLQPHQPAALLVRSLAQQAPFPTNYFHQVVATFPGDYFLDQPVLSEVYRLLAPGGRLVLLPFGWITNHDGGHRLMAWVYRLVGQAPALDQPAVLDRFADPFQQAGFSVVFHQVDLPSSSLLLIVGKKLPEDHQKKNFELES